MSLARAPGIQASARARLNHRKKNRGRNLAFIFRAPRWSPSDEGPQNIILQSGQTPLGLVDLGDLLLEFLEEEPPLKRIAQDDQEVVVVPGFFDVLEQADVVDGPDGAFLVGVAGQQDPGRLGMQLAEAPQQFDPVHLGHQEIGNDDVGVAAAGVFQGRGRRGERTDFVFRFQFQERPEAVENHLLVVDDHQGGFLFLERKVGLRIHFSRAHFLQSILVMATTLAIIRKSVDLTYIPGFNKIQGLITLLAVTFILTLLVMKTRIFLFFGAPMITLVLFVIFLFLLLKWSMNRIFGSKT